MKTILIPTDFSNNSWNAVEYVIKLFNNIPCTFFILHVDPLNRSGVASNSFSMPSQPLDSSVEENLKETFKRIRQISTNKAHHFIALQEYGNLLEVIRKNVSDKKVDLIVMGTKGASGIKRAIVGSNTGDVITKVHCNLLVIPEKANPSIPKQIFFPTDYNIFYSHSILESISNILGICKANLKVVNVSKPDVKLSPLQNQNMNYLKDYLQELFLKSHSIHHIEHDRTKIAIEEFVEKENIDMVIMVAKNLNFLQQLLFDTTIKKISFQTKIPLLVLHE